jgi:hypothetical protein
MFTGSETRKGVADARVGMRMMSTSSIFIDDSVIPRLWQFVEYDHRRMVLGIPCFQNSEGLLLQIL